MSWTTIESDPGVFTELISSLGVEGVQVEELYDLDLNHLLSLQPIYGLIFLFKWEKDDHPLAADGRVLLSDPEQTQHIFFARQTVQNACATQAIVSILLNRSEVQLGAHLSEFRQFAMELDAEMRGEAIGQSEFIRAAHNAFARPEPFIFDEKKDEHADTEDAFHFIGYVPLQDSLYELDGLKPAPISLGSVEGGVEGTEWLVRAKESIDARIRRYAEKEIRFNLLAIVRNRSDVYSEKLEEIRARKASLQTSMENESEEQKAQVAQLGEEEREAEACIAEEQAKYAKWRTENARRQHNYVPFIFHTLRLLAEKGKLQEVMESAAKVTAERNARQIATRQRQRDEQRGQAGGKEDKAKAAPMDTSGGAAPADAKPK